MKNLNLRNLLFAVTICLPNAAQAFCQEPRSYLATSFEDQINDYLGYLLCLHNSQVDTLNEHARLIDQVGDEVNKLRVSSVDQGNIDTSRILSEMAKGYSTLELDNQLLRQRVAKLEARIALMELADKEN